MIVDEYMHTERGSTHWRDYGGGGPPIVLVHGLGGSVANWDAIGPPLARWGHVVALDLPGFGLSPPGPDWELSTHVEALTAFIAELGPPVTLIGNSMGGLLAEMVSAHHPELVQAQILISPATPPRLPDPRIHWPTATRLLLQATPGIGVATSRYFMRRYTPEQMVELSLEMITHHRGRVPLPVVVELTRVARARWELPWTAEAVPRTGRSIARLLSRPSEFVAMIRDIKAPTLVVHGMGDRLVSPTSVEWMCSLRPDWLLVQMDDTGHTPQLDAPVRLLEVMTPWLERSLEHEITA